MNIHIYMYIYICIFIYWCMDIYIFSLTEARDPISWLVDYLLYNVSISFKKWHLFAAMNMHAAALHVWHESVQPPHCRRPSAWHLAGPHIKQTRYIIICEYIDIHTSIDEYTYIYVYIYLYVYMYIFPNWGSGPNLMISWLLAL